MDYMTVYIENPKKSTTKLLELVREFRKVTKYKVNTQESYFYILTKYN